MREETTRRVLILGCGYVGSALGESLVRAGHDVIGTTTKPGCANEIAAAGVRPEVIRLAETQRLTKLVADRDVIYMCVAAGRSGDRYREVYLEGAKSLLQAITGSGVRRIIYTSSTRVYAQRDGEWVDESSPTEPLDENGRTLVQTEQTLLEGIRRVSNPASAAATMLRLGAIHGPRRDLAERIRGRAGAELSNGHAYVNLIHLDDIVAALTLLLDVPYHGVLNLTDDHPIRRRELYDHVLQTEGLSPIKWMSPAGPPNLGKRVRNTLVKQTLGLSLRRLCL